MSNQLGRRADNKPIRCGNVHGALKIFLKQCQRELHALFLLPSNIRQSVVKHVRHGRASSPKVFVRAQQGLYNHHRQSEGGSGQGCGLLKREREYPASQHILDNLQKKQSLNLNPIKVFEFRGSYANFLKIIVGCLAGLGKLDCMSRKAFLLIYGATRRSVVRVALQSGSK